MTDEHRADVTGYEGDPVIRTPVLDQLAEDGVVFTNAYAPSPICVPGRQCMMSGELPRTCCAERYGQDLPPFYMTFARQFSRYAYATVACGKLHHQGVDQMQGWTQRCAGDTDVSPLYIEDRVDAEFAKYYRDLREVKWSDAKEIKRAGVAHGPYLERDEWATEAALHVVRRHFLDPYYDRATPNVPILLKLSLLQPHYPFFTDQARFEYYLNRVQPYLDEPVFDHPFLSQREVRPGVDVSAREIRRAVAAVFWHDRGRGLALWRPDRCPPGGRPGSGRVDHYLYQRPWRDAGPAWHLGKAKVL